jgi:hypothetical protein
MWPKELCDRSAERALTQVGRGQPTFDGCAASKFNARKHEFGSTRRIN